jgi:ubiquinone/menaquinone biosynthesis C-methylase UbiE
MIHLAKKNVPSANFLVRDIRNLSVLENDYDAAIAAFSIVHLSNDEVFNLIKDVGSLLKSKGVLYISCIEGSNSDCIKTSFSPEKNIYFNHFSENFITRALTNNDFSIINSFNQDYPEPDGTTSTELFFYAQKKL